jgi:hypothetical protein
VERFLRIEDPLDEEAYWQVTTEIASRLLDSEQRQFHHLDKRIFDRLPIGGMIEYRNKFPFPFVGPKDALPEPEHEIGPIRHEALDLAKRGFGPTILVISGSFRARYLNESVLFTGNGVTIPDGIHKTIVIADGDFKSAENLSYSLVVARGSVNVRDAQNSVIVAGGKVANHAEFMKIRGSLVREDCKDLLGWVRFFEISDAGMEVKASDKGMAVTRVIENQPPHKAGLLIGDIITAVDKVSVTEVEQFRRQLRHGIAAGTTNFIIQRMGVTLELSASFTDWEPPPLKP